MLQRTRRIANIWKIPRADGKKSDHISWRGANRGDESQFDKVKAPEPIGFNFVGKENKPMPRGLLKGFAEEKVHVLKK